MITKYVAHALAAARCEQLDDGTLVATVRGLRRIAAVGESFERCRAQLAEVVEAWILVRVARGLAVPTLRGATVRVRRASSSVATPSFRRGSAKRTRSAATLRRR